MKKKMIGLMMALLWVCLGVFSAHAAGHGLPMWQQLGYDSKEAFCQEYDFLDPDGRAVRLGDESYNALEKIFNEQLAFIQSGSDFWSEFGYASYADMYENGYYTDQTDFECQVAWQRTWDIWQAQRYQQDLSAARTAMGLPLDQVGVMLNGQVLKLAGEYAGGAVYAPVRELAEALGGTVSFDGETQGVAITKEKTTLTFPLYSTAMTVERDGDASAVKLPAPVYTRGGVSYIPVRAFAQALGYAVGWDERFETVVLLDRNALVAQIDQDFTVVNNLIAAQSAQDAEKVYRAAIRVAGTFTEFNTLDGNKQYPVAAQITVVSQGESVQMDMTLDLAGLVARMEDALANAYDIYEAEELGALANILQDPAQMQIILNYDEDTIYFHCPALIGMYTKLIGGTAVPAGLAALSQDAWYKLKGIGMQQEAPDTLWQQVQNVVGGRSHSVGAWLYDQCANGYLESSVYFCDSLKEEADKLRALAGDSRFTQDKGAAALAFDSSKLGGNENDMLLKSVLDANGITSMRCQLTIVQDGKTTGKLEIRQPTYAYSAGDGETMLSVDFSMSRRRADITIFRHVKNTSELKLEIHMDRMQEEKAPSFAPPKSAIVIDLSSKILSQSAA